MILFSEIFDRAVMLFDDADINAAYFNDPVSFQKIMLPYLLNGKNKFSSPIEVAACYTLYTPLQSEKDILVGNGTNEVAVDEGFVPVENSVFSFKIKGIPDPEAYYDNVARKVVFSKVVPTGVECSVEYCFAGMFSQEFKWSYNANFLKSDIINERVKDILAHCTLLAWCEREQNFILEIRNLLTDTDFKMYSPANSIKAKTEWYNNVKQGLDDLINKLNWDMRGTRRGKF